MVQIDQTDAKILRALLADGRKSFTALAKDLQISNDLLWKRYQDMKKEGIITGATAQFNFPYFGYQGIASILLNVDSENLKDILLKLKKIPDLNYFQFFNSTSNIGTISLVKTLRDLDYAKIAVRNNPINSFRSYLWIDVKNMPENLNFGFEEEELIDCISENRNTAKPSLKIDEIDMQIVDNLLEDGRMSFTKIGDKLGVTSDTISRRYRLLVKNNYIKTCIQINPILLGYKATLFFYISLTSQKHLQPAIERLCKIPNLTVIVKISGDYDLVATIFVRDIEDMVKTQSRIMEIMGVGKFESCLALPLASYPGPRQYITTF